MSNKRRLPRAAKRKAVQALAEASKCPDCGVRARRPRREREGLHHVWTLDIPHLSSCPSRVLPDLRHSMATAAVSAAQPVVGFRMAYLSGADAVVVAGER